MTTDKLQRGLETALAVCKFLNDDKYAKKVIEREIKKILQK